MPRRRATMGVVAACALIGGCHLGDLLAPDATTHDQIDTTPPGPPVAALALRPADTTLHVLGDTLCLTWTALDSSGTLLTNVTPSFSFVANPDARLAFDGPPGCLVVLALGTVGGNATVRATVDTVTADATVAARPAAQAVPSVFSLELTPVDTTFENIGDVLCLTWTARDSTGAPLPDVVPIFSFRSNPSGRFAFTGAPGCVRADGSGTAGGPARVRAATDTATAEAKLRMRP